MKRFFEATGILSRHAAMQAFCLCAAMLGGIVCNVAVAAEPVSISGIYPHLAMFNNEGECGTGAVVPWADRLWVVTYAPHMPKGSSDKLYEITHDLKQTVREESIGGTPANRFIHAESQQLFIGPYAIDRLGQVRVIPYSKMFGRPTGNARHLTDPANKIYYATMEEGLYEVDVKTLDVKELWADEQVKAGKHADLPGYHGKGLYSGQGVIVYANNGEHGDLAQRKPDIPSGVLAEWNGSDETWKIIARNQFTEVTGPAGIAPTDASKSDVIWSIGWDHRSLILMSREQGAWHRFRLPKSSHSYDGAHGWNTEWPRIRDIGESDLLMTMHGAFWRFPKDFSSKKTAGIVPRSNYLKVIGDFTHWQDRIVCGCDDTAKAEFLNKRKAKGSIAAPQSQSNLWFLKPEEIDHLGPVIGRGGVWVNEGVAAGTVSDPFLIAGYKHRWLHLHHQGKVGAEITIELDREGKGDWQVDQTVSLNAGDYWPVEVKSEAVWARLRTKQGIPQITAWFYLTNPDARTAEPDAMFAGIARRDSQEVLGGIVRARGENERSMSLSAVRGTSQGIKDIGYYELDAALQLKATDRKDAWEFTKQKASIVERVFEQDRASILFVDDQQRRWRLPRVDEQWGLDSLLGAIRVDREVATERDLFHCGGTFYELPAENAGGLAKLRPVASHPFLVHDFCSYRGLFVLSGVLPNAENSSGHLIKSDDGKAAIWVGAIDDLWRMGKPRGVGGPWFESQVKENEPSDAYLMLGFDRKSLTLSHQTDGLVAITAELDLTGDGVWVPYKTWRVAAKESVQEAFPEGLGAYWIRFRADRACTATAQLKYE